jgi:SAM-dependent methyltransferase
MPPDPRKPTTSHAHVRRYYDEVHYQNAERLPPAVSRHLRHLAAKIGIAPGQPVLDVACGTGMWLVAVRQRGAQAIGIDVSRKAVATGRSGRPDVALCVGVAESLPFADKLFDLVSCLGSLEHFLDVRAAMLEMTRVARDDARFLLLVPNAGFLSRRLGLYRGTAQVAVREDVLGLSHWQALFESVGLSVEQRWRDLHVLSWEWITSRHWYDVPLRAAQAAMLAVWPLAWQYQVYYLCRKRRG